MTFAVSLKTILFALSVALVISMVPPDLVLAGPSGEGPGAQIRTVLIPVEGMTCASCVAQVKKALKAVDGVAEVWIDLEQRSARVRYDEGRVAPERLVDVINRLGYKAGTPRAEDAP